MSDGWTKLEEAVEELVTRDIRPLEPSPEPGATIGQGFAPQDTGALVCLDPPQEGKIFPLGCFETVVGRAPRCEVTVDHDSISRRHLRLRWTENGPLAVDLKSKNGLYVNGERELVALLRDGDLVRAGAIRFRYESRRLRRSRTQSAAPTSHTPGGHAGPVLHPPPPSDERWRGGDG